MYRYVPIIFLRVLYVGPGARLAVVFWGQGAQVRRHPGSAYWVTNQMSLGLKHFVLEGVM